jgi:signal transduction histidine kinase
VLTLRRKFAILVSGLAVGVLAVQATAVWSILTLEREIAWPLRSVESVLRSLHASKRNTEDLANALGRSRWVAPDEPFDADPLAARRHIATLRERINELDGPESYLIRTGIASTRTLRRQAESALELAMEATEEPSRAPRAVRELSTVHELIERIEGHILSDARFQTDHAVAIRRSVLIVSGACLLALALTVFLGFLLFTRWIVRPVQSLRAATQRISAGDYEHRVDVRGEDELAQLSHEVNQMASTIDTMTTERVEQERLAAIGEMVSRVAHNLRNPLAGIRSLAEVTRSELDESSDLRAVQTRIIQTVDRFEGWLRDLLRSTRPLQIQPTRLDLASWVQDVVAPLRPLAESRRITMKVIPPSGELVVNADPGHLEQAVVAVVTNAIQAAPNHGRVEIRLSLSDALEAQIDVVDSGPGVSPEDRERIFRPYFTSKPDGTGIGLALAKHVIQQHRGNIAVWDHKSTTFGDESSPIGGWFRIRLPAIAEQ